MPDADADVDVDAYVDADDGEALVVEMGYSAVAVMWALLLADCWEWSLNCSNCWHLQVVLSLESRISVHSPT